MCQRCRDMEMFFREKLKEAQQLFPPDQNEQHIAWMIEKDPTLDETMLRALFGSRGVDYGLANAFNKAALDCLLSNVAFDPNVAIGVVTALLGRLVARQQELLTMSSGESGGTSTTPPKKPESTPKEKLH